MDIKNPPGPVGVAASSIVKHCKHNKISDKLFFGEEKSPDFFRAFIVYPIRPGTWPSALSSTFRTIMAETFSPSLRATIACKRLSSEKNTL